jgi:hypothetical protein
MRGIIFLLAAGLAGAQTMTEVGASAAGGAIGSAAGKKVSEGISSIFGKVDKAAGKAAKPPEDNSKGAPLLDVGPAVVVKGPGGGESVPPPPPPAGHRASVAKPAAAVEPLPEILPPPPPPPPPPPAVTVDDLKKVTNGMSRENVLRMGAPSSRIMMDDDEGHLLEVYSYADKDISIGRVRLKDGAVASVEIR